MRHTDDSDAERSVGGSGSKDPLPEPPSLQDLETEQIKAVLIQLAELKASNDKTAEQLKTYGAVADEVQALKVFETAKSYLISWITLGGITALVAGFALFGAGWKYAKDLVDAEIKSHSDTEISSLVQKQIEHQVDEYFKSHADEYSRHVEDLTITYVRQQIGPIIVQNGYKLTANAAVSETAVTTTGPIVDYTPKMQSARDQGTEGGVVGFALAAALEYQILKKTGQAVRISPREIYNLAKTTPNDSGAQLADGLRVLQTEGAVLEDVWPYKAGEFSTKAPPNFASARRFKIAGYAKVKGIDEIKSALQNNGPVIAGISVYESFETLDVTKTGAVPLPKPKEILVGGHAICIVGFDDEKKTFKFLNSWGSGWGDKGYGYLPYDYLKNNSSEAVDKFVIAPAPGIYSSSAATIRSHSFSSGSFATGWPAWRYQ
jgi:C1A family cysteine protease